MLLSNLKSIAEKNLNAAVVNCCIGVPIYFTDLQRRAILDAATIAGLQPLRLIHETTATALAYGIYKTDLPETDPINVAFVDVGHSGFQMCIAAFKKGQLKILAHSFDSSLGGLDFDDVLFAHFAAKFKDEYKFDVYQNSRACLTLRTACEKLKKVLSAKPEAWLNIECLMADKDVKGHIKRNRFEQISSPILERMKKPLKKVLAEAGLTNEEIHTVEVVGSGSRVPAIIRILTEFFGKKPLRNMSATKCVAKGCALQCFLLSPIFRVNDFQVNESFPFPISMSWKRAEGQNGATGGEQTVIVIPKGSPIPSLKAVTILKSGTVAVDLQYADISELQAPAKISSYTIGPFHGKGDGAKLKIRVRLNLHGIVSIESATLLEEEVSDDPMVKNITRTTVPVVEDSVMVETTHRKNAVEDYVHDMRNKLNDKYHQFLRPTEKDEFIAIFQEVEDWLYEDGKDETKSVFIAKLNDLKKVVKEFEKALQDRIMVETKHHKHAVEAYVHDMRNKLNYKYHQFLGPTEKDEFILILQEVKDWLYNDGKDENKSVFIAQLNDLKKIGDSIEERYKKHTELVAIVNQILYRDGHINVK